jgi:large subunit ribosomal protein L29
MKAKQFHEMNTEELKAKLKELKQELFNLRFQHAIGQLSNPMTINTCKKDIARVLTILKERELGIEKKAKAQRS